MRHRSRSTVCACSELTLSESVARDVIGSFPNRQATAKDGYTCVTGVSAIITVLALDEIFSYFCGFQSTFAKGEQKYQDGYVLSFEINGFEIKKMCKRS